MIHPPGPRIDLHVHLAGVGTGGSACWISPEFRRRPTFLALRMMHGIDARAMRESADQDWVDRIAGLVADSSLDCAVALGFDGVYDRHGRFDPALSQMVIPPSWIFEACRRHPGQLLPGPSINPHRADARERLEECIEGGAVLIKWLPAAQVIDPAATDIRWFLQRLADVGIPLLVHSGGRETTFRQVRPELKDLRLLRPALEMGVRVIVAHQGAPVLFSRDVDQTPLVREWLERFPDLWLDDSGMANPTRFSYLARHAGEEAFVARTLHGSDFPVPVRPLLFPGALGPRRVLQLERLRNPLERDLRLKLALGYPEETLSRAAKVIANLDRWRDASPADRADGSDPIDRRPIDTDP